jgi:hypothetical protein
MPCMKRDVGRRFPPLPGTRQQAVRD